jgi:hypothetical protein
MNVVVRVVSTLLGMVNVNVAVAVPAGQVTVFELSPESKTPLPFQSIHPVM